MLVVLMDFDNDKDYLDYIVSTSQILVVYQECKIPPLCFKGEGYEILDLELYSISTDLSISSITFTKVGLDDSFFEDCYLTTISESRDALFQPIASSRFKDGKLSFQFVDGITINEGRNVKISLFVEMGNFENSSLENLGNRNWFAIFINSSRDVFSSGTATLISEKPQKIYVGTLPKGVLIDGEERDWLGYWQSNTQSNTEGIIEFEDGLGDLSEKTRGYSKNVDIIDYKALRVKSNLYSYTKVNGNALEGNDIPILLEKERYDIKKESAAVYDGPMSHVAKYGTDWLYLLIDSDNDGRTGERYTNLLGGYDWRVELTGYEGNIISLKKYKYDSESLEWFEVEENMVEFFFGYYETGNLSAFCRGNAIEISVSLQCMGISETTRISLAIYMSDWQGNHDFSKECIFNGSKDKNGRYYQGSSQVNIEQNAVSIGNGGTSVNSIVSADLDNDGYIDFITTDNDSMIANRIKLWRNNHDGSFTSFYAMPDATYSGVYSLAVADIDCDGNMDIIAGEANGDNNDYAVIFRNPGASSVWNRWSTVRQLPVSVGVNRQVWTVSASDIDKDGDVDVAIGTGQPRVRIYRNPYNAGSGNPWTSAWTERDIGNAPTGAVYRICMIDIDVDGYLDIVNGNSNALEIRRNPTTNQFGTNWVRRSLASINVHGLGCDDFDSDGDNDIAVGLGTSTSNLRIYQNPRTNAFTTGTWTEISIGSTSNAIYAVSVADLDNDGRKDIVSGDIQIMAWENPGQITSTWASMTIGNTYSQITSVCNADVLLDGDLEVVFCGVNSGTGFARYYDNVLLHRNYVFDEAVSIGSAISQGFASIDIGDLDNDGDLDVAAVERPDSLGKVNATVWQNPGSATVSSWTAWNRYIAMTDAPSGGYQGTISVGMIKIGDLDKDGYLDIIWTYRFRDTSSWRGVMMVKNPGDPWTNNWPTSRWTDDEYDLDVPGLSLGDLDRDGNLDVVITDSSGIVHCWRNTGNPFSGNNALGKYTVGQVSASVLCVALSDLNKDGYLDVIAGSANNNVYIWENDRTPWNGWQSADIVGSSNDDVGTVSAIDFDNNGAMDIVSGDASGNVIIWQSPGSAYAFTSAWSNYLTITHSGQVNSISVGDLDNDGDFDFASAASTHVYIDKNPLTDGGSWTATVLSGFSENLTGICLADLDKNANNEPSLDPDLGDLDIVVCGNNTPGHIYILENKGANVLIEVLPVASSILEDNQTEAMFRLKVRHNGIYSDNSVVLNRWKFIYPGLSASQINALISNHYLFLDNGNGIFDPLDTPITTTVTVSDQAVTFQISDTNAVVSPTAEKTFFYVIKLTADASAQTPNSFEVRFKPDGYTVGNWNLITDTSSFHKVASVVPSDTYTTGTITVVPEFNMLLVPIFGTLIIFSLIKSSAIRKRKNRS
ncbi:MAG: VCBS repeat-containing protein [Thermoplasmata archaeon]